MALKYFHLSFCITLLIFLASSNIGHATRHASDEENMPSPFGFIKHLEGYHKGNKSKEIHLLKKYLNNFGYLDLGHAHGDYDDVFDHDLESAVKAYQSYFHINPTGILDVNTVSKMVQPRCGVADITPILMNSAQTHYSFFPNSPRWPPSKKHLTYNMLPHTPSDAFGPVRRAFDKWASTTRFRFSEVRSSHGADILIGFFRGDHGDGHSFDGPGGTLAHAFEPTNGRFHYDADERWVDGAVKGAFDLETLAIHEIGHVLGLGHSTDEEAIMWPIFAPGVRKNLHEDDIKGIRVLYHL